MKNVDKLYEKYYNTYKNDFDTDELSETKKKKFGYRQFELFNKTDKKLTLDGDIKKNLKEIENQAKIVDEKKSKESFSYEPTALVNSLLSQSMQDLRKSLNVIKQQNMKLNEDERNNKNKNGKLNNIQFINFLSINFFLSQQPDESKLPKWLKVSKQRFVVIKSKVQNARNNSWQARLKQSNFNFFINFNESNKLFHEIENSKSTYEEASKIIENIHSDINKIISMQTLNPNQINMPNTLFMVNEIFTGKIESIGVNKKGNLKVFKEKSDKEKQESDSCSSI